MSWKSHMRLLTLRWCFMLVQHVTLSGYSVRALMHLSVTEKNLIFLSSCLPLLDVLIHSLSHSCLFYPLLLYPFICCYPAPSPSLLCSLTLLCSPNHSALKHGCQTAPPLFSCVQPLITVPLSLSMPRLYCMLSVKALWGPKY